MLGLLSGLGRGALESKYEQKLLQRKRFEEWQKQQMELSNEEKAYISNLPRYQRALELANEKLGIAENANALPTSPGDGLLRNDTANIFKDWFRSNKKVDARNEFSRYLEGELLPAIMQIEGLPMNEYSVKSFKQKFNVNKLTAENWRKFFGETKEKLNARALDIQKKIRGLSEEQLSELMQDPQIEKTIKEEATRKLDSQIEGLDSETIDALIKLSGDPKIEKEPEEVKKNFLREMGLQIIASVPAIMIGAEVGASFGPLGIFLGGLAGGIYGAYAGTAAERGLAGDKNPLYNAIPETWENIPAIAVGHVIAPGLSKILKGVRGRFNPGREPLKEVVGRGFDTAVKDAENIGVKDVGKYLKSAAKETNNPFQRKIIEDLESKFSGEAGSYKAKEFAGILSGIRENSFKLAEKHGIPESQVKEVVSKLEERFLPLRANVSKTMGLLSGASSALEKGNVRKVAEIFGELPEKIAVDGGVFTKDQVVRGFLLENSNAIRNKYIKPIDTTQLMEIAEKVGLVKKVSSWAARETLAKIGLNGLADKKIAKLFAHYSFGSAKDSVTKDLMAALQGKIIEEQSGFIAEMLKKAGMSGTQVGMSSAKALTPGAMKWLID
ncbi:VIT1/CCC1 transporter family protein [Wolbachia endosymbiont (group B) of Dolichovespula media]|uniref:hypothetical protein n=1 Tax=Wolbachia endosymbiont (group B) of Dolichovespula media TaxID=2954001 RepID=UPI0021F89865|nr:hypothetical protein [Wolbachia endosymbiont (group B) of Dolichovespula media]